MPASNDTISKANAGKTRRGVLYVVWPGPNVERLLERSIASVQKIHPELPIHIQRLPEGSTLLDKARMYDFTPFRETLFLDADTVILERLDFGFDQANRFGLACCICECPWARRFTSLKGLGDLIEYNTGVLFFSHITKRLFDRWASIAKNLDSRLSFLRGDQICVMSENDQASFAEALRTDFYNPYVLPLNWNFRPTWQRLWFGDVKIWHDYADPLPGFLQWNKEQSQADALIQFAKVP
jgi:hypothetical protein